MKWLFSMILLLNFVGCIGLNINSQGSSPLNHEEMREYNSQIMRCYKMGGTRIVKIDNVLRCF